MSKNEKGLWKDVKKLLGPSKEIHIDRIESHATALGSPDVDYCINGYQGKLELKYTKTETKGLMLRPSQVMWHKKRADAQGVAWILAEVNLTSGDSEYLFIPGARGWQLSGVRSIALWREQAFKVTKGLNSADLIYCLQRFRT